MRFFNSFPEMPFSRLSVIASPAESLWRTIRTSRPFSHFLFSKRNSLANWADEISRVLFSLFTTTAMWCAKQGINEKSRKPSNKIIREHFMRAHLDHELRGAHARICNESVKSRRTSGYAGNLGRVRQGHGRTGYSMGSTIATGSRDRGSGI